MTIEAESVVLPKQRYTATVGRVQLTGIQALARLPIEQHRRDLDAGLDVATLISGYEGSPLAGFDLELNRMGSLLGANDVVFVPGLNEESAATAVQGSQLAPTLDGSTRDGVLGIWYGKAPGLDRATDAIRHGTLMGAHPNGGAVLLVGDDPAAKSSSVPCASDLALQDLMVPFLHPGDSAEILAYGRHAVALSRATGLWTALKIVTAVADGSSTVHLGADVPISLPAGGGRHEPTAKLLQPTLGRLERDLVTTRLRLAREYARLNRLNQVVGRGPHDRVGVVASGRTWHDVQAVLARSGLGPDTLEASPVRLLKVAMPYPLDPETLVEFASGLETVLVVEEKRSFMETALRDVLYGRPDAPRILGKLDADGRDLIPAYGDLDADTIAPRLHRVLSAGGIDCGPDPDRTPTPAGRNLLSMATRTPYFCSGCPHNSSTKPVEGALVGAGIGCHAMVLLMDEAQVGAVTGLAQMGGEGVQWLGIAPFSNRSHYVQNLGDGTFDHSGSLAIRAAVAAGANITYKLLFNSAVAMTGGQRAVGGMDVSRVVDVLLAEGVARVLVTTEDRARYRRRRLPRAVEVWHRSRLDEAQRVLAATPGVTVLVHDQECATEKRRRRKRTTDGATETRVFINERICEGCGDCGRKSNCLSVQPVQTLYGRKTRIHQGSCNTDLACLDGDCPAFMSVTVDTRPQLRPSIETLGADELPVPPSCASDPVTIRLTGIGGTGVVTVSQVLATAGLLAGLNATSLDQTGLAQKGGAVVSDVRLGAGPGTTNKTGAGECDLYLGCDVLVAADPANLAVASVQRTVTVLSTSQVPTGAMVSDPTVLFPDVDAVVASVARRSSQVHALDARALSQGLFGDDQYANMLLVGAAFQTGRLPLPAEAIEQAIELNGVAVETNLQAFRRGRQYLVAPATVRTASAHRRHPGGSSGPRAEPEGLDELTEHFAGELRTYQNAAYADTYRRHLSAVRESEELAVPGSTALTETVARHLFKLMAYKDEYEVARLALLPELAADLAATFGPGARASYRLHPPALRALGLTRKLSLGSWFRPALRVLYSMRHLRGTVLDPFGRAHVRRVERDLVTEYVAVLRRLADTLTGDNLEQACTIAALPDLVRGYEEVKLSNVEDYRDRLSELLDELGAGSH